VFTAPVGNFSPTPLGCVTCTATLEWCVDWYGEHYENSPGRTRKARAPARSAWFAAARSTARLATAAAPAATGSGRHPRLHHRFRVVRVR